MEKKKEYQHPAVEVVEFKSKVQLMDGTTLPPETEDPEGEG